MSSDQRRGEKKTLGSLFLLISFLQKWLRLCAVRMCVIAQTPLISPFGSIGFRERKTGRGGAAGKGGEGKGGVGGEEEEERRQGVERSDSSLSLSLSNPSVAEEIKQVYIEFRSQIEYDD